MPPTLKKWDVLVSARPLIGYLVSAIVLTLHVWIPHGKIAETYFFSELSPLVIYGPLKNKGMEFFKCRISKRIKARNLKLVTADRG